MVRTPVVLLGLYDTGLYVAQSLAKYNIPVYGFDYKTSNPGFYSRHIKSNIGYHPVQEQKELLQQLIDKALELFSNPILIPTSEDYIGFMLQFKNELQKFYKFLLPVDQIIERILSKEGQFEMARKSDLPVPEYWCIKTNLDFKNFLKHYDSSRVIFKALDQTEWKTNSIKKAYMANNFADVLTIGNSLIELKIGFIIQKVIDGECTNNFEFNALLINGELIESCIIQKIRQYPPSYGAACFIQNCQNPEIEKLGRRFVIQNGIEGFSNTEFKLDPEIGIYYFIETNARAWLQIRLTEYLGKNFVLKYYNYFTSNISNPKAGVYDNNIKWVDIFSDFVLWWRFLRKEGLSLSGYLSTFSHTKYFGILYLYDLRPFFHTIFEMVLSKFKNTKN